MDEEMTTLIDIRDLGKVFHRDTVEIRALDKGLLAKTVLNGSPS